MCVGEVVHLHVLVSLISLFLFCFFFYTCSTVCSVRRRGHVRRVNVQGSFLVIVLRAHVTPSRGGGTGSEATEVGVVSQISDCASKK